MAFVWSVLIAVASMVSAQAVDVPNGWRMKEFMISVWGGPHDEATARAFAEAGFNTVMGPLNTLELCRRHGLKLMAMDAKPDDARRLQRDEAVWGWFVRDEPPPETWPDIAKSVAAFHEADPFHPAYVNLVCSWDADKFCEMVKPRFLSYDYYQWWWGAASHFRWLEVHREVAQRYGLPMLVWVEANADPRWEWGKPGATYLPDNLPKIRQSVYTSLAYGAKGIQWFVWTLIFERSPQDRNKPGPALTEAGRDVAKINRELRVLGPVLVRLQSTAVYHTEPVPPGTRPFPQDAPVAVSGRHITAGFFEGADKSTFVMIVNRHIGSRAWPKLVFHRSVKAVEMLDRQSGRWRLLQTHAEPDGRPSLRVVLDKGDGVLLRLRGKPAQL